MVDFLVLVILGAVLGTFLGFTIAKSGDVDESKEEEYVETFNDENSEE